MANDPHHKYLKNKQDESEILRVKEEANPNLQTKIEESESKLRTLVFVCIPKDSIENVINDYKDLAKKYSTEIPVEQYSFNDMKTVEDCTATSIFINVDHKSVEDVYIYSRTIKGNIVLYSKKTIDESQAIRSEISILTTDKSLSGLAQRLEHCPKTSMPEIKGVNDIRKYHKNHNSLYKKHS